MFYVLLYFIIFRINISYHKEKRLCGKKDWGIRIDESDIKFERTVELQIANKQTFIETVIKQWEMIVLTWQCRI